MTGRTGALDFSVPIALIARASKGSTSREMVVFGLDLTYQSTEISIVLGSDAFVDPAPERMRHDTYLMQNSATCCASHERRISFPSCGPRFPSACSSRQASLAATKKRRNWQSMSS
jgi:hypothetical protein